MPNKKKKLIAKILHKGMSAESKAIVKAAAAGRKNSECSDVKRALSNVWESQGNVAGNSTSDGCKKGKEQPQKDDGAKAKLSPEKSKNPSKGGEEKEEKWKPSFTSPALEDGLQSLYNERATWIKLTFPSLEEAYYYSTARRHCTESFFKRIGKVVVSPARCKVISPPFSKRPCDDYTAWIVAKVVVHQELLNCILPKYMDLKRGINVTQSIMGWPICHPCAYTYGHLGPYCIKKPEHRLQTSSDYAKYLEYGELFSIIATEKPRGSGSASKRKYDAANNSRPIASLTKLTTPYITKDANNCIVERGALWDEPLADFYFQMEFDQFNLLNSGKQVGMFRKYRDYAYREKLYGYRQNGEGKRKYKEENRGYFKLKKKMDLDWQKTLSFYLPPFDPYFS